MIMAPSYALNRCTQAGLLPQNSNSVTVTHKLQNYAMNIHHMMMKLIIHFYFIVIHIVQYKNICIHIYFSCYSRDILHENFRLLYLRSTGSKTVVKALWHWTIELSQHIFFDRDLRNDLSWVINKIQIFLFFYRWTHPKL